MTTCIISELLFFIRKFGQKCFNNVLFVKIKMTIYLFIYFEQKLSWEQAYFNKDFWEEGRWEELYLKSKPRKYEKTVQGEQMSRRNLPGLQEACLHVSWVSRRKKSNSVPQVVVAEAQIDKARNDVEGRTDEKYTEAESVTFPSQGRVLG